MVFQGQLSIEINIGGIGLTRGVFPHQILSGVLWFIELFIHGIKVLLKNNWGINRGNRRGNVENHHHQNHSDSLLVEPLLDVKGTSHMIGDRLSRCDYHECTDSIRDKLNLGQSIHAIIQHAKGENCINTICEEVYDGSGNVAKMIRNLVIKRISYLLLPGSRNEDITVSTEGHIHLENVCEWLTEDCGIMVEEADIGRMVAGYMQDRVAITYDMIHASTVRAKCRGGGDACLSVQTSAENSVRKDGLSQNASHAHARTIHPQAAMNVIGPAGGVSVNRDIWPTNLDAVGFSGILMNRPIKIVPI